VVLLEFLLHKARLVFLDVTFSILFFSPKSFRKQVAVELLRKFALLPC